MSTLNVDYKGKVALVSGSNRGIGKAIAIELLNRGAAKVYAGARNVSSLDELKIQYGDRLIPVQLDITDDASIAAAAEMVEGLDILVNNAGVSVFGGLIDENTMSSLQANLEVNVLGTIQVANAFLDQLRASSGAAIVNVSSIAGLANIPAFGCYSVSKAALHSVTQGQRAELAPANILVSGVYPGPVDTDMAKGFNGKKETPGNVASSILDGIANGVEDIYPDTISNQAGTFYASNPKAVEKQFSSFGA